MSLAVLVSAGPRFATTTSASEAPGQMGGVLWLAHRAMVTDADTAGGWSAEQSPAVE